MHSTSPGGVPPTIGRYRVVERIGHGAMGDVYEAIDEDIGRRVAIRVMPPDQDNGVTGQVTHPNVVTVFDRGDDHGRPYVVMELLDGLPLPEYLHRPEAQSLHAKTALMLQVCDGLRAAHDLGVVHGHLKPGHVLVQPSGVVKLLDLGLPLPGGPAPYASPEQVNGGRADQRSDIFSAAAVFHFMLSGRPPLAPGVAASDVPEALARVIAKALDEQPRPAAPERRAFARGDRPGPPRAGRRSLPGRAGGARSLLPDRRADRSSAARWRRRLGLAAIERECDQKFVQLASAFPEFGRAGNDSGVMVLMDPARASAALAQLQTWHNEVLAELSVLQAANGGASMSRRLIVCAAARRASSCWSAPWSSGAIRRATSATRRIRCCRAATPSSRTRTRRSFATSAAATAFSSTASRRRRRCCAQGTSCRSASCR